MQIKGSLWVFLAVSLFCLGSTAAVALPTAELTLQSDPGDFIGQGQTVDIVYTPTDGDTVTATIVRTVGGEPAFLSFFLDENDPGTNTFALLDFATDQLGIPFQPGIYLDAQRASFATAGHPGLDVSFQNRGSNTLTGSFTVNSVSFFLDAGNVEQVGSLDVSFVQHSEGATPALHGRLVYSAITSVPEPATIALVGLSLLGIALARRRETH